MKFIKFFLIGIIFGIVMTKSEAISWFRIQEMFLFDSIHMYGIIGVAVVLGAIITTSIKKFNLKTYEGEEMNLNPKPKQPIANLAGGILFGLGWAMTGACPGPLYVLVGHGFGVILIVILSAIFGVFIYGLLRDKLPH